MNEGVSTIIGSISPFYTGLPYQVLFLTTLQWTEPTEESSLISNMERWSSDQAVNSPKTGTVQSASAEAQEAAENEHNLSFFDAVKLYPKAVGWSIFFSLG